MSLAEQAVGELAATREFFNRSTGNLTDAHSSFAPAVGMMTAAQQIAHAAHTIDWFIEGAFRPEGFDLNFEAQAAEYNAVTSIADARAWFERAVAAASATLGAKMRNWSGCCPRARSWVVCLVWRSWAPSPITPRTTVARSPSTRGSITSFRRCRTCRRGNSSQVR
jgi:hypothetical protein